MKSKLSNLATNRAALVLMLCAALVVSVFTVPAFAGDTVATVAAKALGLAKKADKRSKQALAEVKKVGQQSGPGARGPQGERGAAGATGPQGAQGERGLQGLRGLIGEKGEKGETGATGAQGAQGEKGDTGDTGATGPKGDTGDPGADGADGADGTNGTNGTNGRDGIAEGTTIVKATDTFNDTAGDLVSLDLDSGSYLLSGNVTTTVDNANGFQVVKCSLISEKGATTTELQHTQAVLDDTGGDLNSTSFAPSAATEFTGMGTTKVTLRCLAAGGDAMADDIRLTATLLNTVNELP